MLKENEFIANSIKMTAEDFNKLIEASRAAQATAIIVATATANSKTKLTTQDKLEYILLLGQLARRVEHMLTGNITLKEPKDFEEYFEKASVTDLNQNPSNN